MDRGLYIAASGMLAEQIRQDQIANDLANASTPGYKADRTDAAASSASCCSPTRATGATIGARRTGVQVDRHRHRLHPAAAPRDRRAARLRDRRRGLLRACGPAQGVRYTRNGQFTVDAAGPLVTATGDPVLGRDGQPVRVGADGSVDPRALGVVLLDEPAQGGRQPRHRHARRRRPAPAGARRRARGLGRRPGAGRWST